MRRVLLTAVACGGLALLPACARRGTNAKTTATSSVKPPPAHAQAPAKQQAAQRSLAAAPTDDRPAAVAPGSPTATKQPPKQTPAVLSLHRLINQVQRVIDSTSNFSADFRQLYESSMLPRSSRSNGHVWFQKPGRMRWDYHNTAGKMTRRFLVNGNTLWVVDAAAAQVHVNRCFQHDALSASVAFLWGRGQLQDTFRISLLSKQQRDGMCPQLSQLTGGGYCLQLVPKQPCSTFAKLVVVVDKQSFAIVATTLVDALGNRNRFVYHHMQRNRPMPQDLFVYRPSAGMAVLPMPGSCVGTSR